MSTNRPKIIVAAFFIGSIAAGIYTYHPDMLTFAHYISVVIWFGMTFFHTGISV